MIEVLTVNGLPQKVRGCIGIDDSGGMILLNACCPIEERAEALAHEIGHMVRGDFRNRAKTVHEIELNACIK